VRHFNKNEESGSIADEVYLLRMIYSFINTHLWLHDHKTA